MHNLILFEHFLKLNPRILRVHAEFSTICHCCTSFLSFLFCTQIPKHSARNKALQTSINLISLKQRHFFSLFGFSEMFTRISRQPKETQRWKRGDFLNCFIFLLFLRCMHRYTKETISLVTFKEEIVSAFLYWFVWCRRRHWICQLLRCTKRTPITP